jgi:hypothetical protein
MCKNVEKLVDMVREVERYFGTYLEVDQSYVDIFRDLDLRGNLSFLKANSIFDTVILSKCGMDGPGHEQCKYTCPQIVCRQGSYQQYMYTCPQTPCREGSYTPFCFQYT